MPAQILLVEDDPISRTMIKGFLESRGYAVDAADDGVGGIRLMRQGRYDLALVDYHLPEIDGYMSARLMRDLSGEGGPKLAAITADHQGLMARVGDDAVFDGVLVKPIAPQALFDFVANMLAEPVQTPTSRAAAAFLKMPRHELGRQAAAAFWRERGLPNPPRAAVLPQPKTDQIEALSLCFELCEPLDAEILLLLDTSGLDRLASLRCGNPAVSAPAVDAGIDDDEACEAAFRVNDPACWSRVAALVAGRAARQVQLQGGAEAPCDLDLRLAKYLFLASHPLRIVRGDAGAVRIHGAGGFGRDMAVLAVKRLEARGLLIRHAPIGESAQTLEIYDLSEAGREALTGGRVTARGDLAPTAAADMSAKTRILLAIETPVNRDITASMLQAGGYEIHTAATGAETITALRMHSFDLLVTDARMKDTDAATLARQVRESAGPHRDIPMIVLSANSSPAEVSALQAHGVDAVLRRPFRSRDLYEHVERFAKRRVVATRPAPAPVEFDQGVFDGLLEFMETGSRRYLLGALQTQIEAIMQFPSESEADRAALAADVHAMISAAGMLGFGGLSTICRCYCEAVRQCEPADVGELRAICVATSGFITRLAAASERHRVEEARAEAVV